MKSWHFYKPLMNGNVSRTMARTVNDDINLDDRFYFPVISRSLNSRPYPCLHKHTRSHIAIGLVKNTVRLCRTRCPRITMRPATLTV